jgi:hypothetical protein
VDNPKVPLGIVEVYHADILALGYEQGANSVHIALASVYAELLELRVVAGEP